MDRYINANKLVEFMERNREIEEKGNGVCENVLDSECFDCFIVAIKSRPSANVREIGKKQWHIIENSYDESAAPTEAGMYLVIDEYGNEYVDYFFNEPRMTAHGVSYWRDSEYTIRAWIKMDGDER